MSHDNLLVAVLDEDVTIFLPKPWALFLIELLQIKCLKNLATLMVSICWMNRADTKSFFLPDGSIR